MTVYATMDSPLGRLLLAGEASNRGEVALSAVSYADHGGSAQPGWTEDPTAFADVTGQLDEYFDGRRTGFDLTRAETGTAFQRRVWDALDAIPYGVTTTYGALATEVGAPRDRIRAVGAAVGANPLLIVRACHRVIGADGSLTGYAGGVPRKADLLTLEGALLPLPDPRARTRRS